MKYLARIQDKEFTIDVSDMGQSTQLRIGDEPVEFSRTIRKNKHRFLLLIDSKSYDVEVNRKDGRYSVFIYGREFEVTAEDERLAKIREVAGMDGAVDGHKEIVAPMPGLIVTVHKGVGDLLNRGEGVVVMEAMKMENELKAESEGEITEVLVKPGQSVEKGECLVRLK
jgi:biotin carboxyl carrier protein